MKVIMKRMKIIMKMIMRRMKIIMNLAASTVGKFSPMMRNMTIQKKITVKVNI